MQVALAATLFQAAGSVIGGIQEASMLKQQSSLYQMQANAEAVSNQRDVALEKASNAQESLERTKKLRRIMASTVSAGAYAGIGGSQLIESINQDSSYEASVEDSISKFNSQQRLTSLQLNSATEQLNLNTQASLSKRKASGAMISGISGAASSLGSYSQWRQSIGKA